MDRRRELTEVLKEQRGGRTRRGSTGCIEDMWKRKREEEEEREGFSRSKKTQRSPEGRKREKEEDSRKEGGEAGDKKSERNEWKEEMEKMMKGVMETCMNKWGEELRKVKEEVREGREEMREAMKEIREREERWIEDREAMEGRVKGLEVKMEELEIKMEKRGEVNKEMNEGGEMDRRLREIEKKMERKEREERRKNIVIRGLEVKEGKRREAVEQLLKEIGVEAKIKEVWRITIEKEKDREAVGVKIEEEEKRGEIWRNKKKLRGRRERILEDWTWKERRMRWKLEEIAREEERKGRKVWVGYGKVKIDEQWWRWDEDEENLRDVKGNRREIVQGEEKEERKGKAG